MSRVNDSRKGKIRISERRVHGNIHPSTPSAQTCCRSSKWNEAQSLGPTPDLEVILLLMRTRIVLSLWRNIIDLYFSSYTSKKSPNCIAPLVLWATRGSFWAGCHQDRVLLHNRVEIWTSHTAFRPDHAKYMKGMDLMCRRKREEDLGGTYELPSTEDSNEET